MTLRRRILPGLILGCLAGTFAAQAVEERYLLTGHFQLRIDDDVRPDAKIYLVDKGPPKLLLVSDALEQPVLLTAGERIVQALPAEAVEFHEDDPHVATLDSARAGESGPAKLSGQSVLFSLPEGKRGVLEPREPVLGEMTPDQIFAELPEYERAASSYEPVVGQVRLLRQYQGIEVHVFFGTWCRHCEQVLPYVAKLAKVMDGSPMKFHFHAVSHKMVDDPLVRHLDVASVPTAVVMDGGVSGTELARLAGDKLRRPESALCAAIVGAR